MLRAIKIDDFLVDPGIRHRGLGSDILDQLDRVAHWLNVPVIWGCIEHRDIKDYDQLAHFYHRHGYTIKDRFLEKLILGSRGLPSESKSIGPP